MARVPYVRREDLPAEYQDLLTRPINVFAAMANAPSAMKAFSPVGKWIRNESSVDGRLREMAIIQVGYSTGGAYEFSHHVKIGRDFGVTDDDVRAIVAESAGEETSLSPLDKSVLRAARDLTLKLEISDQDWKVIEESLGREHATQLIMITSYYNYVVRVLLALQVDVEDEWSQPLKDYGPPEMYSAWR
ncbi:hypothetical protein AU252_01075 [Pseudarthrobacter sulfonivorans]|uniref:Carboxymuconolactone decarboxylase-like domain-containing protein n=1 Tax=Pseudarthrobacter sulfonivorans TaxID=121292 RepID=A0A0U3GL66_9MICC|nr:carboxymuconolactone decarboxylase family protein [Pseudarthrobacter sulfonivorans]ALV39926.1 hypothetical protein AU252_01075 [Pseudarthrobacter sulfonivorans]